MYVGLLTARFKNEKNLEQIAAYAGEAGYEALEIHTRHLDIRGVLDDGGETVRKLMQTHGLRISSIAHYVPFNGDGASPEPFVKDMTDVIAAAEALGVDTVCTLAGFETPGKTKMQTLREDVPDVFGPLAEQAARKNIRIAFENWFRSNLQHLDHFAACLDAIGKDNVGLNFDPSHLYWQRIDYLAALREFADRIFHTHAKDVALREDVLARVGVLDGSWWRYVIPGFGEIDWGRYILALREIGFEGAVSVEHEDSAFDSEGGFDKALRHLEQFV